MSQVLTRTFYSNVVIISKDGKLLSTISDSRANWYLKKNLATEIHPPVGYSRAIRLSFKPHSDAEPQTYDLNISEDKCVLCGKFSDLTLHHVIPYVIRKYFPLTLKSKARQWCVLLCIDCHEKVETITQPIYKERFPLGGSNPCTNNTLEIIKHKKAFHKITPEKLKFLFDHSNYKTIDEIPNYTPSRRKENMAERSKQHQAKIKQWAEDFIAEHDGVDGVKKYFREMFLLFNPKYLPQGYLEIGDTRLTPDQKSV